MVYVLLKTSQDFPLFYLDLSVTRSGINITKISDYLLCSHHDLWKFHRSQWRWARRLGRELVVIRKIRNTAA